MASGEAESALIRALAPTAAFALGLVLERFLRHDDLKPAWRANLGLWLTNVLLMAAVCGACGFATAVWLQDSGIGLLNAVDAPFAVVVVASVLGLDLVAYAWHRANHRVGFLWRFHRVHHADANYHVSTALRFHPGELLLALPVRLCAIALLGASPAGVIVFEAIFGIANVLEHGNFDLPASFERAIGCVLITPALHRRHHSVVRSRRDSNFGTISSLWDRLAGTLQASASAEHFETGLDGRDGEGARSLLASLAAPIR